jgi:Mrp family chromosome partitioning ATPase
MSILAQSSDTDFKSLGDVPAFHELIAMLRTRYDWVVLDTPPVLPVDDARVIAGDADAVVFLARWRSTPAKAVELALQQLGDVGANVIGVSLTVLDVVEQARSGFGDAFYYHKKYQAYYA